MAGECTQHAWLFNELRNALKAGKIDTCLLYDATENGDDTATDDDMATMAADLTRSTSPLMADISDSATTDEGDLFFVDYEIDLGDIDLPADLMMGDDSSAAVSDTRMSDKDIQVFGDFFVDPKLQIGQWLETVLDQSQFHELRKNAAIDLATEVLSESTRTQAIDVLLTACDDSIDALLLKLSRALVSEEGEHACDAFISRAVLLTMKAIIGTLKAPSEALRASTITALGERVDGTRAFWQSPSRSVSGSRFYFQPSQQVENECDAILTAIASA